MIYEVIVSTKSNDGIPHVVPMGISKKDTYIVLRPFKPSKTLENILRDRSAVLNVVTDVRIFAGAITGRLNFRIEALPEKKGFFLVDAVSYLVLSLVEVHDFGGRPSLYMIKESETQLSKFLGFNRAQAAVIEGSILMSRLGMLPQEKIEKELEYLGIAIEKTAGKKELQAWEWLIEKYKRFKNKNDGKNKTLS